ncbi:uncharacterized protein CMU_019950 [Cryptosporidium muris RN66]|uniref:Uncharacterized protein n=1 Tax=Cryptosporidium muris (strain RN66) TaxID=441375 RepID=B6AJB4_CRYMR|nr:uncharacterized protein CMU_019950 [Cryptosporidium muris RN66]EEA08252.1 hypothetical protein CMU_019950 [Cryptosporidium muris RN66]|eukprot:XP_002142601.1 hypothetical protein [Cryptosporidium muris RN66]
MKYSFGILALIIAICIYTPIIATSPIENATRVLKTEEPSMSSLSKIEEKMNEYILSSNISEFKDNYLTYIDQNMTLSEAFNIVYEVVENCQIISESHFLFYKRHGNGYYINDMWEVLDCFEGNMKISMKLIKQLRQHCNFHIGNTKLGIVPKTIGEYVIKSCNELNYVENKIARLVDYSYLMRLIKHKAREHNDGLVKLAELVYKNLRLSECKSPAYKKKSYVCGSNKSLPNSIISRYRQERRLVEILINNLKSIDDTLPIRLRNIPKCIHLTDFEYKTIMNQAAILADNIWYPMGIKIRKHINNLNKCYNKRRFIYSLKSAKHMKENRKVLFTLQVQNILRQLNINT